MIIKVTLPYRDVSKDKVDKSRHELQNKMEPDTSLDLATGGGGHSCDGRSCVRIQSFRRRDLITCFGDSAEKEKSELQ